MKNVHSIIPGHPLTTFGAGRPNVQNHKLLFAAKNVSFYRITRDSLRYHSYTKGG